MYLTALLWIPFPQLSHIKIARCTCRGGPTRAKPNDESEKSSQLHSQTGTHCQMVLLEHRKRP